MFLLGLILETKKKSYQFSKSYMNNLVDSDCSHGNFDISHYTIFVQRVLKKALIVG